MRRVSELRHRIANKARRTIGKRPFARMRNAMIQGARLGRRLAYSQLNAALRRLADSRSNTANRLAMAFIERAPLNERQRDGLYVAAISRTRAARIAFAARASMDAACGNTGLFQITVSGAAPCSELPRGRVHIFLEHGADIAAVFADHALNDRDLSVYAFDNRREECVAAGLEQRTKLFSLRERFPEISEAAETLRHEARAFSELLAEQIFGRHIRRDLSEILALIVEDDVNHHLSLLYCFNEALRALPDDEPAIIVVGEETLFPAGFKTLAATRANKLYGLFGHVSPLKRAAFGRALQGDSSASEDEHSRSDPFAHLLREASELVADRRSDPTALATRAGKAVAQADLLLAFDPISSPYIRAVDALAQSAARRGLNMSIFGLAPSHAVSALNDPAKKLQYLDLAEPNLYLASAEAHADALIDSCLHQASQIWPHSAPPGAVYAARSIATKLSHVLGLNDAIESVAPCFANKVVMTTAGRTWRTRLFANAARRHDAHIVDIQTLNILPQRKYRAPIADTVVVIDEGAALVHRDFLGVDEERIRILGSPTDDLSAVTIAGHPERDSILFASQLLPEERIDPVLEALFNHVRHAHDRRLIIKMHPRETDARADRLAERIKLAGLESVAQVERNEDVETFFPRAVACVTFYSNVGRQAHHAGVPVVTPYFDDWRPPIRLDEEGLAEAAYSPAELSSFLSVPPDLPNKPSGNRARAIIDLVTELSASNSAGPEQVVIADTPKDLSAISSMIGETTRAIILASEKPAGIEASPPITSLEFSSSTAQLYSDASEEASEIAAKSANRVIETAGDGPIGAALSRNRAALTLMMRVDLFRAVLQRRQLHDQIATLALDVTRIISASRRPHFQSTVANALSAAHFSGQCRVDYIGAKPSAALTRQTLKKAESAPSKIGTPSIDADGGLDPNAKTIILSTAWHLKTVPPTVTPILERFANLGYQVLAVNLTPNGVDSLSEALGRLDIPFASLSCDKLSAKVQSTEFDELHFPITDIVDEAVVGSIDALGRERAQAIHAWETLASRFLHHPRSFSLACPGRQWHADVAHDAAQRAERLSVTLQNAYLFKGYTYTAPRGRMITAIDARQRDVFVEYFDVPADTITVVGCPRFDSIARNTNVRGETTATRRVLFAAQPGLEAVAASTLNELASALPSDVELRLKLHPRMSDHQASLLSDALKSDRVNIVTDTDIMSEIAAADIVATAYSNVGLEAAIAGRPVIYTSYEDWYKELGPTDCGVQARDPRDCALKVSEILFDANARSACLARQTAFLDRHPALRDGTSAQQIEEAINAALEGSDFAPA